VSRLDVQVTRAQRLDATGATVDALQVTARNLEGRAMPLASCAVLLPLGLEVFSDPPRLDYPFTLETGAQCSDFFDCREIAKKARECGYPGKVRLQAVFVEDTPWGVHPAEHRSDPFIFDAGLWP